MSALRQRRRPRTVLWGGRRNDLYYRAITGYELASNPQPPAEFWVRDFARDYYTAKVPRG